MIELLNQGQLNQPANQPAIPLPFPVPAAEDATNLPRRVAYLLSGPHDQLPQAAAILAALQQDLAATLAAFSAREPTTLLQVHQTLYQIYEASLGHPLSSACQHEHAPWLAQIRQPLEAIWLQNELPLIQTQLPADSIARNPAKLCDWFAEQAQQQSDLDRRLLAFLQFEASAEQFGLFIRSDATLDCRFCDALALAQIQFSPVARAEIVRNMADECSYGDGNIPHVQQFGQMLTELGLEQPSVPVWTDWRPYAGYNLHFCFGLNRQHFFKGLGSLAMPELFDPQRSRAVVAGLERLYTDADRKCQYFYNHIEIDANHGERWLRDVVGATVALQPEAGRELATGGLFRMQAMRQYNAYLAEQFGLLAAQEEITQ